MCGNCDNSFCPCNKYKELTFGLRLEQILRLSNDELSVIKMLHESKHGKWKPLTENIY